MKIYLDVCALCRPYDDQNYLRIKFETVAVKIILAKVKAGMYTLLVSPVHIEEINSIDNTFQLLQIKNILGILGEPVNVDMVKTKERTEHLWSAGLGIADAAHIAFAEISEACFISCDDKLIKKCGSCNIKIWCGNPVDFCVKEGLK
ncbi:MAG: hypothetical protein ABRQ39_28190 [Candidatus Eremiobacterota bacterium]